MIKDTEEIQRRVDIVNHCFAAGKDISEWKSSIPQLCDAILSPNSSLHYKSDTFLQGIANPADVELKCRRHPEQTIITNLYLIGLNEPNFCPICVAIEDTKTQEDFFRICGKRAHKLLKYDGAIFNGINKPVIVRCNNNKHAPFEMTIDDIYQGKLVCPCIDKSGEKGSRHQNSSLEYEVLTFVKSVYEGKIIENDRSVLGSKELDIYLPDVQIAIEVNGLYCHSVAKTSKETYHYDKFKECADKGIRLITVWQDDWENKNAFIKGFLKQQIDKYSYQALDFSNYTVNYVNLYNKKYVKDFIAKATYDNAKDFTYSLMLEYQHGDDDESIVPEVAMIFARTDKRNELRIQQYASSRPAVGAFTLLVKAAKNACVLPPRQFYGKNNTKVTSIVIDVSNDIPQVTDKELQECGFKKEKVFFIDKFLVKKHGKEFRADTPPYKQPPLFSTDSEQPDKAPDIIRDCGITRWRLDLAKQLK